MKFQKKRQFKAKRNRHEKKAPVITGVISTTKKGAGYIDLEPKKKSIYIEPGFLNTALNGDTVEARIKSNCDGEVVKVISRSRTKFVGRVRMDGGKIVLTPDDRKMYTDIVISETGGASLEADQKVLVEMLPWNNPKKDLQGKVLKVLGRKGENEVEMESIVLESGFEYDFPVQVDSEASRIGKSKEQIFAEAIPKRKDMRKTLTFTIDPHDAKDFDDAISFRDINDEEAKKLGLNGHGPFYEVGVHIADVSHYVTEGSALDKEALKRGCSVYLVDRTIPMLPEVLSNDVCSLNPHEDKLAFSAVFILDDKAKVRSRWFGKTVINSAHRFTYETAQAVIDGKAENVETYSGGIQKAQSAEAGMQFRRELTVLNGLAKHLMKEKFSAGAIEFEQEEIKFRLDQNGKPVGVFKKERLDTHKLVEEYMLLANREVAKFIFESINKKGLRNAGSIYRIHEAPDKEKMKSLAFFVKALGYNLAIKDGVVTARALNDLLDQIEDTPHESLIRTATIRSMQKAVYSTKNVGHFGLAFRFYTHFTSPIRRYPDLLVHRILAKHLYAGKFGSTDLARFERIAENSTSREIDAAGAERDSVKLKQVEYMSGHVGEIFEGTISGVTKWGIYIEEKETKSEGMIRIGELGNDYFNYDEKTYSIKGERTGKKFTLGDSVKFKVVSANLDERVLEYEIVQA